ncbi:DUF2336 domain-containing protein [Mesorhizobium sp. KR2-14]|uniref:DUF2336 domain-containing protein n=1 Tax=Mesorhizobium sp. KR2-14 TaxID=3156610 RepID=UPI0032B46BC8
MIVGHFLKWLDTARVSERAAAASALARAYVQKELPFEDRCAAEAALTFLLDDPSAKVRQAMAEALSMSRHAPFQVVSVLAGDQPEVAASVIARSPLLTDADLIDHVASGSGATQSLIASRPIVSMAVSAAIAEVGEAEACLALLCNDGAEIAMLSFRRMAERHGDVAVVREALIADTRLPSDCRHMLLVKVGEALKRSPLVVALMGEARAERVLRDACVRASLTLIETTPSQEHAALIEHLRLRGDLTSGFLIRAIAHGKVDFFGAAMVALTDQGEARVRALLASGRDVALAALFRSAGLAAATHGVILVALKVWREVADGKRIAGAQEVSWLMLQRLGDTQAERDLASLLKAIHVDALRDNARRHALSIAASTDLRAA